MEIIILTYSIGKTNKDPEKLGSGGELVFNLVVLLYNLVPRVSLQGTPCFFKNLIKGLKSLNDLHVIV